MNKRLRTDKRRLILGDGQCKISDRQMETGDNGRRRATDEGIGRRQRKA